MYKALLILLTSTILFADINGTDTLNKKIKLDKTSGKIESNENIQTSFYLSKKMQKKHSSFISKLKGIALVVNKENNQTKQIKFSKEKNNTIKIYISPKIQKEYPSILEGLIPIKKEAKKNKSKIKKIKKSEVKTTFYIDKEIEKKYSKLIKLIKETESMDDDERQYWFDIMPSMTDKQIGRLKDILEVEKKKLQELEIKYQKEIKRLNEKHLIEWSEFQLKKKQEKELNSTATNYDDMLEKIDALKEK